MQLHLKNADAWERLCSSENNRSATNVLEVESIHIFSYPQTHLLEIALTKLSEIVKLSSQLKCIEVQHCDFWNPLDRDPRVMTTVCDALMHSRVQQKVQVEFDLYPRMTCELFLPVANLMKNCKRKIGLGMMFGKIHDDDGVSDLMKDALRHLARAVTELDLSCLGLSDDEACALSENLMANTTLVSLDLHHNEIGHKGAKALTEALKHNGALTELDLQNNSIGKKGGVAIENALLCNRTLEKLNLGKTAIGDEGALALAAGLREGSSLNELFLWDAKIGKKGGVALGEALAFSSMLKTLNLTDNPIGDEGAIAISSSLVRNTTLKKLNLSSIGMRTEGCSALAGALRSNTSLEDIDIGGNRIGDEGVVAVADVLKENTSLKTLLMRYNNIGDEGAIALAAATAFNETLEYLGLDHNPGITEEIGVAALINGLNRNSTLTEFFLDADHAGIEFALRRNRALLEEAAWMKRFSDQDIRLKGKVLSKAMERYSVSEFTELTFLFLRSQVSTIAVTNTLTHQ